MKVCGSRIGVLCHVIQTNRCQCQWHATLGTRSSSEWVRTRSAGGIISSMPHCPKWSASQSILRDLACVMNVIFSEPTRRLLARAVCHNPSKQITRQGPSWSLSDPWLEIQKTLREVGWQRQETAKAFFLWHMNMRRKGKTINNILFCSDWTFVRCGSSFKTREEQEQEAY